MTLSSQKQDWLYNINIHYIWTFFSSVLFLSPIITLFYLHYWLNINWIVSLIAIQKFFTAILEIPTSTIWDSIWRVKLLRLSVLSSFVPILLYFLFPSIFIFYIAVFFSSLGSSLWSWTWHAKLQEDLEVSWMEKDFWKIIWRLIALQRIGQLITPIIIFFVLKFFLLDWYKILAGFDVFFWMIAIFFVFKFREINSNNIVSWKKLKDKIGIQIKILKNSLQFMLKDMRIFILLFVMILANDLHFIWNILLPNIVENWLKDFISSFVIWIVSLAWILWAWINHKISNKFWLQNTFIWVVFCNMILHFMAYFFFDIKIIFILLYTMIAFVIWVYTPIWNHLLMNFTEVKEKATVRSIFIMVIWLFESLFLFLFSFLQIKICILILSIMMFLWLILWLFYFKDKSYSKISQEK